MHEKITPFKKPSSKHQPKGLTVLYEDHDIIVVNKTAGLLTMGTEKEKEKTAHFLLNDYVKRGNQRSKNRVLIVHRLDRDTSGILIFAKNEHTKRYLQDSWKEFNKSYFTIVEGRPKEKEGIVTSFLKENKSFRVYSVDNTEEGKFSKTGYKVIKESKRYSLLEIQLFTGRKHQIRVHMSESGHPVVGDKVYGNQNRKVKRLALHSASLTIKHPVTKEEINFKIEVPPYFKTLITS